MVETYQRRSALAHFSLNALAGQSRPNAGITIGEIAHRAIINIRGNAGDLVFSTAVKVATGVDLPVEANTVSAADDIRILWLGPNEWWVVADDAKREELIERLRQSFAGQHTAVTDVSESRTVITIAGPAARDVLARGISLDLHPRAFGPGQCAQTGMAKANIVLHQVGNEPSYEIYILKSFADYLWRWIGLVAEDFGLAVKAE
ncbi:sarcosine oxidase subunit gamma [Methyloceanibacter sp.]|uniref:sarcosine oxidase subunit gamma n=1 Tax=Methyloceanibacter sp. TaxID=1965321 RepID=UPI002D4186A9|nr:sarcosine oxidase subunit gamma family protein [Methyloceanibacter sp.]HZP08599.1 sarcosine oxidase subunit gamma family protein [Methyloceanibacter sp.]